MYILGSRWLAGYGEVSRPEFLAVVPGDVAFAEVFRAVGTVLHRHYLAVRTCCSPY